MSDDDEEAVLRKYVKNLEKVGESWTGHLEKVDALEPMERELLTIGVSFKTVSSRLPKQESLEGNPGRLLFSLDKGVVPIRLDVPFRVISKVQKECLFGKDRHKTQEERAASMTFRRTKTKLQKTKKKGCVASMHLKVIETFPDFKVEEAEGISKHQLKRLKTAQLARLTEALSSGQALETHKMIFLTMSRKSCHTEHDFSVFINFGQTVDASVSRRIRDLVREGITSVPEVRECLRYYVEDVLFAGKQPPDPSCRAFYPTNANLGNHIQMALRKERCSDLDQEVAAPFFDCRSGTPLAIDTVDGLSQRGSNIQSPESEAETHQLGSSSLPTRKTNNLSKLRGSLLVDSEKVKEMAMYCTDKKKLEKAHLYLIEAQKLLLEGTSISGGNVVRGLPREGCSGEGKRKLFRSSTSFGTSALKKSKLTTLEHSYSRGEGWAIMDNEFEKG
ncbi:unnamed protein product [Ixodes pacificus]